MDGLAGPGGFELREAGLLLRPWRPEDADAVYRACQDPDIQRWTNVASPYLWEDAEGFVGRFTERAWATGSGAPIGVFDAATGELMGSNSLVKLDLARCEAEIGYWTAPWARSRGVATAAARCVARWALGPLGVARLEWKAEVGNHASRLVAARVGVRFEGLQRQALRTREGTRVDAWIGALLPGEVLEAGTPHDPVEALRAATFSRPQPRLTAQTPDGAPLILRAPALADLDAIVAACQDPESSRWTSVGDPYQKSDAESFVCQHTPRRWAAGVGAVFALADENDAYAGSMELRIDGPRTGDVGYLVAPWARGRGYASAALRVMCAWGFAELGLERVEWRAYVGNHASRRVAEKAGFTVEGMARSGCVQRGRYRDAWTGAILASDP